MRHGEYEDKCDYPGCQKTVDWRKWDKPPKGWGTVTMDRYGKVGSTRETKLVCPEHTMDFALRIGMLPQRTHWKRVLVESPYRSESPEETQKNLDYLRAVMRACLLNGEAPFASHALYTQPGVLDDKNPRERQMGIMAGLEWGEAGDKTVVYTDRGITDGMRIGMDNANKTKRMIEMRKLKGWAE